MLHIIKYIIKDIDPTVLEKEGILIINSGFKPSKEYVTTIAKMMYENLNIWGLQIMSQSTLALYAAGRTTSIVANCMLLEEQQALW